ncbi:MAG: hypothetical protein FJX71_00240 [Alphaproteobacteria bacterium]|nr:hypothetical protein [Alphaproteobacteria bacterium]
MNNNKIRKILTLFIIILGLVNLFEAICFLGTGGVLNGLDIALHEFEELERNNQLDNPPDDISFYTQNELQHFKNSKDLKLYVKEYESSLYSRYVMFLCTIVLFLFSLILRIYFRKNKEKN